MKLRGWLALVFVSLALVGADVVQRLVIAPWVKLRPSARVRVLGWWIKLMAWLVTRPVAVIAGCVIPRPPSIVPTRPGVLVLMNHQSVFDIPMVVQTVAGGFPRIVTRQRYARWIPLISHMVRLYQYPVVDPTANAAVAREALDRLQDTAKEIDVPLVVFPEGHRTRDGSIGPFKRGGLHRILTARPWTVYVYVADGFWPAARYKDFAQEIHNVHGRIEHVATLEWTDPTIDPGPFVDEARRLMIERLEAMRGGTAVA